MTDKQPDALREKMSDILRRTARHKPADELQRLQGEARVMRGLLRQCAEVLCTVEPKSDTEGEELYALLHAIQGVIEPKAKGALL